MSHTAGKLSMSIAVYRSSNWQYTNTVVKNNWFKPWIIRAKSIMVSLTHGYVTNKSEGHRTFLTCEGIENSADIR